MDDLRSDSFRRNGHSLFVADYYRQFNQNLFTSFVQRLPSDIRLPDGFLKRHAWTLALQFICIIIILKVTNWTFSSKVVRVKLPVGVAYGSPTRLASSLY